MAKLSPALQNELNRRRKIKKVQDTINTSQEKGNDVAQALGKLLQVQLNTSKEINKSIEDRAKVLNDVVKTDKSESDITEKILKTQQSIQSINEKLAKTRKDGGQFQKGFNQSIEKSLKTDKKALEVELKRYHTILAASDAIQAQTDSMITGLERMIGFINKIPGGKMLTTALGFGPENMKKIRDNMSEIAAGGRKWKDLFGGVKNASMKNIAKLGLMAAAIGIAIGLFKIFKSIIVSFSKVIDTLGQSFGVMGAVDLKSVFLDARVGAVMLGKDVEHLITITDTLSSNFGIAMDAASNMSLAILDSAMAMGLTESEGANLYGLLMNTSNLSQKQAENFAEGTASMAMMNRVNPKAAMNDIANNAEFIAKYIGVGLDQLRETAIQAKQLGINLSTVEKIADGLLDFQNSLRKELEAQLILDQDIDLSYARKLADAGKTKDMMDEVIKQLGSEKKFLEMGRIEREAAAAMLNLEKHELMFIYNNMHKNTEEAKTFTDLLGKDTMSALTRIMAKFKSIGVDIVRRLTPVLERMLGQFEAWMDSGGWQKIMGWVDTIVNSLTWIVNNKEAVGMLLGAAGGFAMGGLPGMVVGGLGGGMMMGMAKGGSFVTSGPTPIMVGDNPGGKEHVQVTPISSKNPGLAEIQSTVDVSPVAREVSKIKSDIQGLREDMAKYLGLNGTAVIGMGSKVGDAIHKSYTSSR